MLTCVWAGLLLGLWLDGGSRWVHATVCGGAASTRLLAGAIAGASALLLWLFALAALGAIAPLPIVAGTTVFWWLGRRHCPRSPLRATLARGLALLRPGRGQTRRALAAWFLLLLALLTLASGLLWPQGDYDSLSYHLPFTAAVIDSGTVPLLDTPFGDSAQAYQPKNDVVLRAALAPFGDERLVWTAAFAHLPLLWLSIYVAARALGCRRAAALWGAAVTAVAPILVPGGVAVPQAAGAMVDLAFASWWLAFVALAMATRTIRGDGGALLAGLALGLAYGTKYLAVPYTPLVAVVAVTWLWRPGGDNLRRTGVTALAAVATGGLFYARNWWWTGNPLYPIEVNLFGVTLFEGNYDSAPMRVWVFNLSGLPEPFWRAFQLFALQLTGMVDAALADNRVSVLVPVALWCAGVARSLRQPRTLVLLLLAPAVIGLCWWVIPFNYPRFAIPAVAVVGVAAARAAWGWSVPAMLAAQLLACYDLASPPVLALAGAAVLVALTAARPRARRWLPVVAAAGVLVLAGIAPVPPWVESGTPWHGAWRSLLEHVDGDEPIAYAGHNVPYPLRGAAGRQVIYIPTDGRRELRFHDRAQRWRRDGLPAAVCPEPGFYRRFQDPAAWLAALQASGARYLMVGRLHDHQLLNVRHDARGFPVEAAWARAATPALELVYEVEGALLFRVHAAVAPDGPLPAASERTEPDAFYLRDELPALRRHYPLGIYEMQRPVYARLLARGG